MGILLQRSYCTYRIQIIVYKNETGTNYHVIIPSSVWFFKIFLGVHLQGGSLPKFNFLIECSGYILCSIRNLEDIGDQQAYFQNNPCKQKKWQMVDKYYIYMCILTSYNCLYECPSKYTKIPHQWEMSGVRWEEF